MLPRQMRQVGAAGGATNGNSDRRESVRKIDSSDRCENGNCHRRAQFETAVGNEVCGPCARTYWGAEYAEMEQRAKEGRR